MEFADVRGAKVVWLARYGRRMASSRHRACGWASRLESRGAAVKVVSRVRQNGAKRRVGFLADVFRHGRRADVLVLQKVVPRFWLRRLLGNLRGGGTRLVLDFDDRIYSDRALADPGSLMRKALDLCDGVIVSVPALRDELVSAEPDLAMKTTVVPTCVDVAAFPSRPPRSRGRFRVGWVGSAAGLDYLHQVEGALAAFVNGAPGRELVVVCDKPFAPRRASLPVTNICWEQSRELHYFAELDVSLMPLDDSKRAGAKAGFKLIQSLAAGTPVVGSAVGYNTTVVRHGANGFLAAGPQEYTSCLERLQRRLDDPARAEAMHQACRESALRFDYAAWESAYVRALGLGGTS